MLNQPAVKSQKIGSLMSVAKRSLATYINKVNDGESQADSNINQDHLHVHLLETWACPLATCDTMPGVGEGQPCWTYVFGRHTNLNPIAPICI